MIENHKKSFWPYGILLSIFAIVLACIATIIFASHYPVYEDNFYFTRYQNIKYDYATIQKKQNNFEKNFQISPAFGSLRYDEILRAFWEIQANTTKLDFVIQTLNQEASIKDLILNLELSRPHTNEQDTKLTASTLEKQSPTSYTFSIVLPKLQKGRWQLNLKAQNNEEQIAFYTYHLLVQ